MPKTSSPGRNRVTPKPVASTTPDTSQPSTNGGDPRKIRCARCFQSVGFTPAACTRIRIWLTPGSGRSSSDSRSTSGPPRTSWVIPRMVDFVMSSSMAQCRPTGAPDRRDRPGARPSSGSPGMSPSTSPCCSGTTHRTSSGYVVRRLGADAADGIVAVRPSASADRKTARRAGLRRRPGPAGGAGRKVGLPADGHLTVFNRGSGGAPGHARKYSVTHRVRKTVPGGTPSAGGRDTRGGRDSGEHDAGHNPGH